MLDSISLSLGGVAGTDTNTDGAKKNLAETYSQFLTLLTTQLKNQDPLDPMDSKDMTNQMIQLSNTEQQIAQTAKMDEILKINQASAVNSALSYIGKEVDYVGGEMLYKGTPVSMKYYLDKASAQTKISVFDQDDKLVWSSDGKIEMGGHAVTWDGKDNDGNPVPNGNYKVEVGAQDADKKAVQTIVIVPSVVTGIETADGQVLLNIGSKKVAIGSVQAVRQATAAIQDPTPEATN
jgi:flagellar basal-body rod modification protein FlgD